MNKKRIYCSTCGDKLSSKTEGDTLRDYCTNCDTFFYDNPLPVASTIVISDRKVLLVKRKNDPQKGEWCLPSGFAETGESIETAALRELEEETGIKGKVIDFVCVDSTRNSLYGDLIFVTFEAEWIAGDLMAGDDAVEVRFFSFDKLPPLAFISNTKAVRRYVLSKKEYWAILDSFSLSLEDPEGKKQKGNYVSDKLVNLIEKNADIIANRWLSDITNNKSTPTYAVSDPTATLERVLFVLRQFRKWLGGFYDDNDIRVYYRKLGLERKQEGFMLSEILSAISLTRKHIWEFALSQRMWTKTIDIYMTLELDRRMMIFFDRAAYYATRGYQEEKPLDMSKK
jgi:ADP-ribose pyrophosphatase YjhB (NUDIX family)